jgi:hypothetical protein
LADVSSQTSRIPKVETVGGQYLAAKMAKENEEEYWNAVSAYFPPEESEENKHYGRLATKGLANYYLSDNQLREARKRYEELAAIDLAVEPGEKQLHIAGLAGCAVVAYRLKEEDLLPICLAQLYQFSDEEIDDIGDLLREALAEVLDARPRPDGE